MPDTVNPELPSSRETTEQREQLPERADRRKTSPRGPAEEPDAHRRTGLLNWKLGCLATVAIAAALASACGVWAYREAWPQDVEIHNETDEILRIQADVYFCPSKLIAPHSNAVYTSDWLCARPRITFSSPYFIDVECSWRAARARQPVVVRPDLVSCQDGVPMPASPPQR